jgi:hypothetical protein
LTGFPRDEIGLHAQSPTMLLSRYIVTMSDHHLFCPLHNFLDVLRSLYSSASSGNLSTQCLSCLSHERARPRRLKLDCQTLLQIAPPDDTVLPFLGWQGPGCPAHTHFAAADIPEVKTARPL